MPRSIVLAVDGLRASWLGPYGNTWFDTPGFNELASQSRLYQNCLVDDVGLERNYAAYWLGQRFDCAPAAKPLERISAASIFVSDSVQAVNLAEQSAFQHVLESPEPLAGEMAPDLVSTSSAVALGAAMDSLTSAALEDYHCWIHLDFLSGAWDAPMHYREALAAQEEAEPTDWLRPPTAHSDAGVDPDLRLEWLLAAAAQVQALDDIVLSLKDFAEATRSLLIVTGVRGYPLGEHGAAGWNCPQLYAESLHVPLLVRFPSGQDACQRSFELVQCSAVRDLLLDWHSQAPMDAGSAERIVPPPDRQLAVSRGPGEIGIRTAAWYARLASATELYCKPDDQFELNEVANRCEDVAAAMRELAERFQDGEPWQDWTLPELLWNPVR